MAVFLKGHRLNYLPSTCASHIWVSLHAALPLCTRHIWKIFMLFCHLDRIMCIICLNISQISFYIPWNIPETDFPSAKWIPFIFLLYSRNAVSINSFLNMTSTFFFFNFITITCQSLTHWSIKIWMSITNKCCVS